MALSEVEPPHEYMALSKVGPPQYECIARVRTFSIGTPRMTSPRVCFKGLDRTMNTWPPKRLGGGSPLWLWPMASSAKPLREPLRRWVCNRLEKPGIQWLFIPIFHPRKGNEAAYIVFCYVHSISNHETSPSTAVPLQIMKIINY